MISCYVVSSETTPWMQVYSSVGFKLPKAIPHKEFGHNWDMNKYPQKHAFMTDDICQIICMNSMNRNMEMFWQAISGSQ